MIVWLHLAPQTPWLPLALIALALIALGVWAYRFVIPPLPALARRALPALRVLAFVGLVLLLAQPVLERGIGGSGSIAILVDRSSSMMLPGSAAGRTRGEEAERAARDVAAAWRGRAAVRTLPFASRLGADSAGVGSPEVTALGDALDALAAQPDGQDVNGVVVIGDGVSNSGEDPVTAARRLGVPVHALWTGSAGTLDRAVNGFEASSDAQVGRPTPVRVRVSSSESQGTPLPVVLSDGPRELGRVTVIAPGGGAEAVAEFRPVPLSPGLAVWTARVDSTSGEATTTNNARQVAIQVAPGRLGVTVVSGGLNWDLTFVRRALLGDSSLKLTTWVRSRDGWRVLESGTRLANAPGTEALRGQAVVILDAVAPPLVGPAFDRALASFAQSGGGVLVLGGESPGIARLRGGALGDALRLVTAATAVPRQVAPIPSAEARDLLAWDDDPARGDRAWRGAAPMLDATPVEPGAADRVLVAGGAGGPPLLFVRRVGRGQVLIVNGSGVWRWSLSGQDEYAADRGRRLWRGFVRWLAEPVQGEPLRVRPERWLSATGEPVRLFATLQDESFRPVSGALVEGEVQAATGPAQRITFEPATAGGYVATLDRLPPGRYRVTASATRAARVLGRANSEFAVDRWSLEQARAAPDTASLAAMSAATGGSVAPASGAARWARSLEMSSLARPRTVSSRLWESPWMFAVIVGLLSLEWGWRRRRGLP